MPAKSKHPVSALCDDGTMPGRWYTLPAQERDRLIIQLRRAGRTYKRIGQRVGMTESGA